MLADNLDSGFRTIKGLRRTPYVNGTAMDSPWGVKFITTDDGGGYSGFILIVNNMLKALSGCQN